ncbi:MAG: HigA family addiction module antitoxin [Sphaerochaetaceae bacterium]|jgi:HTH-type transcriptional regulator/antitoxin HigA
MIRKGLEKEFIIHPGETLQEALKELQISVSTLSQATGFSEAHINRVLTGKSTISRTFATKLAKAIAVPASFWNALQQIYDEEIASLQL